MSLAHVQNRLRWRWRDREGTEESTLLYVPIGLAGETVIDVALGELATTIGALTDCALAAVHTEFRFYDDSSPSGSLPDWVDTIQHGSFFFQCSSAPEDQVVIDIPAVRSAYLLAPEAVEINQQHADVVALTNLLMANDAAPCVNQWGRRLVRLASAFRRTIVIPDEMPTG